MARLVLLEENDLDTILACLPLGTRRLVKHAWLKEPPKAGADKAAVQKEDPSQAISVRERPEKPTTEKVTYLSLAFPG